MAISVMSAAKTACESSGWRLTNLSLQKLLYLAHMKFLGTVDQPLVPDSFEAWKYGPVVSRLYQAVKRFGDGPITDVFVVERILTRPEHETIIEIINQFGGLSPGGLVELTHRTGGAWANFFEPNVDHIIIPNRAIIAEYETLGLS